MDVMVEGVGGAEEEMEEEDVLCVACCAAELFWWKDAAALRRGDDEAWMRVMLGRVQSCSERPRDRARALRWNIVVIGTCGGLSPSLSCFCSGRVEREVRRKRLIVGSDGLDGEIVGRKSGGHVGGVDRTAECPP